MQTHQIETGVYGGYTYDATQSDESISSGDVIVAGEVVGFMYSAWPVAVTEDLGEWHGVDGPDGAAHVAVEYSDSIEAAISYAQAHGLAISNDWEGWI